MTLGLPLVATAVAVQGLAGRVSSRLGLYAIGVLCAGAAWIVGVLAAVQILAAVSYRYFDSATKTPSQSAGGGSASSARPRRR